MLTRAAFLFPNGAEPRERTFQQGGTKLNGVVSPCLPARYIPKLLRLLHSQRRQFSARSNQKPLPPRTTFVLRQFHTLASPASTFNDSLTLDTLILKASGF